MSLAQEPVRLEPLRLDLVRLDLMSLREALHSALLSPGLLAEAKRCRARIELRAAEAEPLTLWAGADDGPLIALCAPENLWCEVFSALPAPGRQSLGALRRQCPEFEVKGSAIAIAQALPFIERLLSAMRDALKPLSAPRPADHSALAHISGRYLQLATASADWVYAEQAGPGDAPPLLMLHTAGADSRQWHGLMGLLRGSWRMQAFDLPGHGRSPLPDGLAGQDWRLTEAAYIAWVLGFMDAAGLDRVVLMGCSMGSAIGLALLAKHPDRFVGALLLEAPYCSPGRRSPYLDHPEVHGARLAAAWVGSLLSPSSPQAGRDQATWIYSQAAPGVYDGDLAFYSDDFDAAQHLPQIDAARTPLWRLTGDYDYSATPADSQRVAAEVAGAQFAPLPGFGHFPMVENPVGLMPHLAQPLRELAAKFKPTSLETAP